MRTDSAKNVRSGFAYASHIIHTLALVFWALLSGYLVYVGYLLSFMPDMLSKDLRPYPHAALFTFFAAVALLFSSWRLFRAVHRIRRR